MDLMIPNIISVISISKEVNHPVPLLKTIIFNKVDEFYSKVKTQVNYYLNNYYR